MSPDLGLFGFTVEHIHKVKLRDSNLLSQYFLHVVKHDVIMCEVNY